MKYLLKNLNIITENGILLGSIAVDNGIIVSIDSAFSSKDFDVIDCTGFTAFPGLADVHVHLREPGFSYKETIYTGSKAAARGGITAVCPMPNLSPVPDSYDTLCQELELIKRDAAIGVFPYGSITKAQNGLELAQFEEMAEFAVGFSDDGKGVQDALIMKKAMTEAARLGKIIAAHCEDAELIAGRLCIHDGKYARLHNVLGVSSESEWKPIKRDIEICRKTGCKYHVCHVSTKESVELIREAKSQGVDITCETAPHYLVFCDDDLQDNGRFKMNPPLRSSDDRLALLKGIQDGTIDMISTDHAPHSQDEKSKGLLNSLNGVVGLETSFAAVYSYLVRTNLISLDMLVQIMSINPRKRFSLPPASISVGKEADFAIFDLHTPFEVDSNDFVSKGKFSPFDKMTLFGKCKFTAYKDTIPWREI